MKRDWKNHKGRHGDPIPDVGRKRFQLMAPPDKKPAKIPKVADMQAIKCKAVEPAGQVLNATGSSKMAIGVNIETHDWKTGATTGQSGQYGFYTRSEPNDSKK